MLGFFLIIGPLCFIGHNECPYGHSGLVTLLFVVAENPLLQGCSGHRRENGITGNVHFGFSSGVEISGNYLLPAGRVQRAGTFRGQVKILGSGYIPSPSFFHSKVKKKFRCHVLAFRTCES
jgi:hypothetical protein